MIWFFLGKQSFVFLFLFYHALSSSYVILYIYNESYMAASLAGNWSISLCCDCDQIFTWFFLELVFTTHLLKSIVAFSSFLAAWPLSGQNWCLTAKWSWVRFDPWFEPRVFLSLHVLVLAWVFSAYSSFPANPKHALEVSFRFRLPLLKWSVISVGFAYLNESKSAKFYCGF